MGLKARKMITNYTVKTFPAAVTLVFHFPVSTYEQGEVGNQFNKGNDDGHETA